MILGKNKPVYYIQSKPPNKGVFVHHSTYAGLKAIINSHGYLRESQPYKGISLTTDPGRFISPMPLLGSTVDGFVVFDSEVLIQKDWVIPCLYRTTMTGLVDRASQAGHRVFKEDELPPEYKYVIDFVRHNDIFVDENEWVVFGRHLAVQDYNFKLYISDKFHKKFMKSVVRMYHELVFPISAYPKEAVSEAV